MASSVSSESELPVNDPNLAWKHCVATQPFDDIPTRSGPPDKSRFTRIVCISDTHEHHRKIDVASGDILVHCGDFTEFGDPEAVHDVSDWFGTLQSSKRVEHILCIAGNHELTFYPPEQQIGLSWLSLYQIWRRVTHPFATPFDPKGARAKLCNCTYLEDKAASIGSVRFYGSPWQPSYWNWAFNLSRTELGEKWKAIPEDTDVLLTHTPPLGRGDEISKDKRGGCVALMQQVQARVRPRLHVFGHLHEGRGVSFDGTTMYINAANYYKNCPCYVVDLPHDQSQPALLVVSEE